MTAIFITLHYALDFYWWIVIISAIFSWLYAFNVVNASNPFIASVSTFLYHMTEPVLRRIRQFMPNLGTIDISPIIVLFAIMFLQIFLRTTVAPMFGVAY